MTTTDEKKEKQLIRIISWSFYISVLAAVISWFFAPDFSVDPPKINEIGLLLGQLQTSLVILGCTALGIKLTEEKKTLASIGFTMMAITQGVIFVLYVVAPEPSKENLDEVYKLFTATIFLLVPSMSLIAFFSEFPRWVNLLGMVAILPWIGEISLYFASHKLSDTVGMMDFIGQLMMNTTVSSWAYFTWKRSTASSSKINAGQTV
ncbi:MAG: hypothetical protein U0V49_01010 [Saprospiraceae bacterium]